MKAKRGFSAGWKQGTEKAGEALKRMSSQPFMAPRPETQQCPKLPLGAQNWDARCLLQKQAWGIGTG
jgi:hypothetical protein